MRNFSCDFCGSVVFFENDTCLACGNTVGFRTDTLAMATVAAAESSGLTRCANWADHAACNWYSAGSASAYCVSCERNELVPDLAHPRCRALWVDTERAKRRLIFTLLELGLPLAANGDKQALRFRLLADERVDTGAVAPPPGEPVYTGHADGCLTFNVVEADDVHRESLRILLEERYRTMLGHLRHETGHYYWYRLIDRTTLLPRFREIFGDEEADYDLALRRHYEQGAPESWREQFVSAYASRHPWEDFAETWAHCIHILDTLETASASTVALCGRDLSSPLPLEAGRPFTAVLADWAPLTVCLNQLNRSMGMRDAYPFVIAPPVVRKLEFIHDACLRAER